MELLKIGKRQAVNWIYITLEITQSEKVKIRDLRK